MECTDPKWQLSTEREHVDAEVPANTQALNIVHLHSHNVSARYIKYIILSLMTTKVHTGIFWPQHQPSSSLCVLIVKKKKRKSWKSTFSFWFWPGLSPPGSDKTPGCTCTHTSNRALSSGLSHQGPAEKGSLPASCGQRASVTDKRLDTEPWSHFVLICNAPLELVPDKIHLFLHIRHDYLLCSAESQLEVIPGLVGVEDGVLKGVGEEPVHQGAEGYAIFPTWGEVLNVNPLF